MQMDFYAGQDEQVREQIDQMTPAMMPYIGRLIELSCYQEEAPTSELVQVKVSEVFENFKKAITVLMQSTGQCSPTETIEDAPFIQQLETFRGFSEEILVSIQPPSAESLEMTLNHRYGEGTGERIREMLDAFVVAKRKV